MFGGVTKKKYEKTVSGIFSGPHHSLLLMGERMTHPLMNLGKETDWEAQQILGSCFFKRIGLKF